MRVVRSTSSCTCAGAAQILCAVSCCMQERAFHCVPAHTRRTVCRPDRSFALPGMLWGVAQVDLCRTLPVSGFFPLQTGLRGSSTDSVYERLFSEVGLCVCASERQAAVRATEHLERQIQHSWQRSFTAVCRCFQTEQKHPRISVSGGVFYRGL